MRVPLLIAFLIAAPAGAGTPIVRNWAYLPALRENPTLGVVEVPGPLDESAIRLVGRSAAGAEAASPASPVLALAVGAWKGPEGSLSTFPPDARWPGADGRIVLQGPLPVARASGLRNPWEIRAARTAAERESAIECGGTIIGGDGGPVAIVNGHPARRGDSLGDFRVVKIRPEGILLERQGAFIVVPSGRRAIVIVPGT
jgi:hypothetical protein